MQWEKLKFHLASRRFQHIIRPVPGARSLVGDYSRPRANLFILTQRDP